MTEDGLKTPKPCVVQLIAHVVGSQSGLVVHDAGWDLYARLRFQLHHLLTV